MKSFITFLLAIVHLGDLLAQNVGINNTDPQTALDVDGKFRIRPNGFDVSGGGTITIPNPSPGYFSLSGSPTAEFTVNLPSGVKGTFLILENATTGGYTCNVPGLTKILPGKSKLFLYGDMGWVLAHDSDVSQLEKITEGSNTGWRLAGSDPNNYGDIGQGAIDLSYSTAASSTRGATGFHSIAIGHSTTASGDYGATAMGNSTTASGDYGATAIGHSTTASGYSGATAMGRNTTATGDYGATAMGRNTTASGYSGATAMGYFTTASGNYGATAMGEYTTASGESGATAMGNYTTASGDYGATVMGNGTTASGDWGATAMGYFTTASGNRGATAMGHYTTARSFASTAMGRYNDTIAGSSINSWVPTDPLFMVGNGSSDLSRSNALLVRKNGNTDINGNTLANGNLDVILDTKINQNLLVKQSANVESKLTVGFNGTGNSTVETKSFGARFESITADLTLTDEHHTIRVGPGLSTNPTITLPSAASVKYRIYYIVNHSDKDVPVKPGFVNLYGVTPVFSPTMVPQKTAVTLQSDGNEWYRIQ